MANRVGYIAQKRATLCKQINALSALITRDEFDLIEARLRVERLKTLFHAYEELHDELGVLALDDEGFAQMDNISAAFYAIAAKIETENGADQSRSHIASHAAPMGNSTFLEKQRTLKLPVAELPKFNGDIDKWLSFKNIFKMMVESRSDINNLTKFMYLKGCLVGEAARKINLYDASETSYEDAWALLTESYERKRVLVSKHLDAILDFPPLEDSTSASLSKMVDTVRQHVAMLDTLEYQIDDFIIVRTLEKALPNSIRLKWEESLTLDELPSLDSFFKSIREIAFRMSTMERESARNQSSRPNKRGSCSVSNPSKFRKSESAPRALVSSVLAVCGQCRGEHALYRCPVFQKLPVQQRWDAIKSKGFCRNCLRKHAGECTSGRCKQCNRFHHTLLHTARAVTIPPAESNANDSVADARKGAA